MYRNKSKLNKLNIRNVIIVTNVQENKIVLF